MNSKYTIDGTWYHGGSSKAVAAISNAQIDTSLGGGELGVGFYIGNFGHLASAWARHKDRHDAAVTELAINAFGKSGLSKKELGWLLAKEHYIKIRVIGAQRTFQFGVDVVAAPIVGRDILYSPIQLKWEGHKSQCYLNSPSIKKKITKL